MNFFAKFAAFYPHNIGFFVFWRITLGEFVSSLFSYCASSASLSLNSSLATLLIDEQLEDLNSRRLLKAKLDLEEEFFTAKLLFNGVYGGVKWL